MTDDAATTTNGFHRQHHGDDPVCPCGNTSHLSGLYPADEHGLIASDGAPPPNWTQHRTVGCPDCGRYFHDTPPRTCPGHSPAAGSDYAGLRGPVLALLTTLDQEARALDTSPRLKSRMRDVRAALVASEVVRPHRPDDLAVLQRRIDTARDGALLRECRDLIREVAFAPADVDVDDLLRRIDAATTEPKETS